MTLTSNSNSNEEVLDASCSGSGYKLPTDIYFEVDGSATYFHASCSQPLNLGDALYEHPSKGSLILVGFESVSGRTEGACGPATQACGARSFTPPSLSCGAGITLEQGTSMKGVALRMNSDSSIQYLGTQAPDGLSADEFEYTGTSCDGEEVKGKVVINFKSLGPEQVQRSWGTVREKAQCDVNAGEEKLQESSSKTPTLEACKETCEAAPDCLSITYFGNGWCGHFSTPCTMTKSAGRAVVLQLLAHRSHSRNLRSS